MSISGQPNFFIYHSYHYLTVYCKQPLKYIASSRAVYKYEYPPSLALLPYISLSFSLILSLFLFCLFSCPLSLTAPVGTEYGNAIRTTESPSVCGKLNTLSNVPWGLGLQNREGGHGRTGARQNARKQPKMLKVLVVVYPEVLAVCARTFIDLSEGVKAVYVLILSLQTVIAI